MSDQQTINKLSFIKVGNPKVLISILQERQPQACFIYNQAISHDRFKDDITFYTIGSDVNSSSWIVAVYRREDFGRNITISAPREIIMGTKIIPLGIKEIFSAGGLIDWDDSVVFAALEKRVSGMIFDISANVKGNVTEVHPCLLYYMDIKDALALDIKHGPEVSEVRRLHPDKESDFILSTWKYVSEGTKIVVPKCIAANASAGVFVDGKCVSGVFTPGVGLISALYTLAGFRNRGYGKVTMYHTFKEFAKDGCIPCSTVEVKNSRSIGFHQSLGVKVASIVDWIEVKKLVVE